MTPAIGLSALQLATRAAVGAALALAVAQGLALDFPLYAMIAAVIVTDLSPARTRELALPRLAGTVLGCVLGALAAMVLPPGPIAVGVAIFAAMFLGYALGLESAVRLAGYVCAIVILDHRGEPWTYGLLRLVETLIGVGAASAVSLVPKLFPLRAFARRRLPKDPGAADARDAKEDARDVGRRGGRSPTTGDRHHA